MTETLPKQWAFAKSLSGKYLFMSDYYVEMAGLDSPNQMVGKRDSELIWRDQAEIYWQEDVQIFKGHSLFSFPSIIRSIQCPKGHREVLVTKTPLRDHNNNIIGILGSSIDITEHRIVQSPGQFDVLKKKMVLNGSLSGLTLSKKQLMILECVVKGYSAAQIGQLVCRSKRTIEGHIDNLKRKLHCSSKAEMIRWTVISGLVHMLNRPHLPKKPV